LALKLVKAVDAHTLKIVGIQVCIDTADETVRAQIIDALRPLGSASSKTEFNCVVKIYGPGTALDTIGQDIEDQVRVFVLACKAQPQRVSEALRLGAKDALIWTEDAREEFCLRVEHVCQEARFAAEQSTDRRDLSALLDLSEALTTSSDVEATLHQIAKRMAEVMHSERCSIILLGDDHRRGIVVADSQDAAVTNHPIAVTSYPEISQVVRTRRALVVDDVGKDPLFDEVRELIKTKPVGNTALFPVHLNTRVQGILMMRGGDVRTEGLTPRQIRFATIIANATAIAIRNARMYRSIRDRTERVLSARIKAERRLRQLEKYQRFFDLAGDGLAIVDGRGQILFANQAALEIFGFAQEDLSQLRISDVVVEEDAQLVRDLFAGFQEGQYRTRFDLRIVKADGAHRTLSISTASLDPEADALARELHRDIPKEKVIEVAAIISFRDVTETRTIQGELKKTKDFLENVIESSVDAIIASDMKGRILIYNAGAERILGYTAQEVVGVMSVTDLYVDGVARIIMKAFWSEDYGGIGRYGGGRHDLMTKDGQRVPISISAAMVFHNEEAIASVGIFRDLRDRIRMENALESAQKKLEKTERQAAIVELAGTAAHELSQPLTTIMGSAELLKRRLEGSAHSEKMLDRILDQSERMADLLKKIGQITRYETKPYLKKTNIIDLEASSEDKEHT
jgi:PAS domain S-box-containing protein